jgi:hypothetical protein
MAAIILYISPHRYMEAVDQLQAVTAICFKESCLGHGVGLDMEERELLADRTLSEPQ